MSLSGRKIFLRVSWFLRTGKPDSYTLFNAHVILEDVPFCNKLSVMYGLEQSLQLK
jgi:hypothetical protein